MRVVRIYHGGRDPAHRLRERALVAAGADVQLVVPATWPGEGAVADEPFPVHELPVRRPGDVNRHRYASARALGALLEELRPDVLDVHEEPFSLAAHQALGVAPRDVPVVMYAAQNVDKRLPPPFAQYERAAHRRVAALYPCSAQAASVARGKGFAGRIEVLPLGYDETRFRPGVQSADDAEVVLALVGRLVPEKGVLDAVRTLARVHAARPARLVLCGRGPMEEPARGLAASLGVADRVELVGWRSGDALAETYRSAHVVLVPSTPTATWVEQFGRVIVEAQASGAVVVGYDSGSIAEVGAAAAVVVPAGDAESLADATLATLAEDFERRRNAGLALAEGRTWAAVAARQVELYRAAVAGIERRPLPASPRERRARARREFGPTAATTAGTRPFALPLLRAGGSAARLLAAGLDAAAERAAQRRASSR